MNWSPRLPLADITNCNDEINFDSFERFWRVFVTEECEFHSWNFAVINDTIVLSQQTQYCINGFLALKMILVDRKLAYQVKVGDVLCNDVVDLHMPRKFSSKENIISILSVISSCKLCMGCQNMDYRTIEVGDCALKKIGKIGDSEPVRLHYFSFNCIGLLPVNHTHRLCVRCSGLDGILKSRLFRRRSIVLEGNDKDPSRVNNRYLSSGEIKKKLESEHQLRKNAEKREQYAKKLLHAKKEMAVMSPCDNQDLQHMFRELDNDEFVKEHQNLALFWSVQKEMIEQKSRKWHPRYQIYLVNPGGGTQHMHMGGGQSNIFG